MSTSIAIPPGVHIKILPSPLASVADLLLYNLPPHSSDAQPPGQNIMADDFGMFSEPDMDDGAAASVVKDLPIPSRQMISMLMFLTKTAAWKSIRYAHLPGTGFSGGKFPLWVITYWFTVSQVRLSVKTPWAVAEQFINKIRCSWKSPDARRQCDSADIALLQLPWTGRTAGFGSNSEPMHTISYYLSERWFHGEHIDHQLDFLRSDLKHAGIFDCEVIGPFALEVLRHMYRERAETPYSEISGRRNIKCIGDELAAGHRKTVACIGNVNGNHWISIVIDITALSIRYGDSLGGSITGVGTELVDSIIWWLNFHIPTATFKHDPLPITHQADTFSCGVLALNAVCHHLLPSSPLILPSSMLAINQARLGMFMRVARKELDAIVVLDIPPGMQAVLEVKSLGEEAEFTTTFQLVNTISDSLGLLPPPSSPLLPPPSLRHSSPLPHASTLPKPAYIKTADLHRWFKPTTSAEMIKKSWDYQDSQHATTMERRQLSDNRTAQRKQDAKASNAKERQARKRQRDKEDDILSGRRDDNGKIFKALQVLPPQLGLSDPHTSGPTLNIAEVSRPKRTLQEDERQQRGNVGRPRTTTYREASLTNWMSPLLWTHIQRAAVRCGPKMSPSDICKELKKIDSVLFKVLIPQTLSRWIDRSGDRPRWSTRTLERVEEGYSPGGATTRVGALVPYPAATAKILKTLEDLRTASVALTLGTIRGIVIAMLQHSVPQIFTIPSRDGTLFRASDEFIRKFLHRSLGWSLRRSTRAGGKIPANHETLLNQAFVRMAYCIKTENIPSALIVNSDQTQVTLSQGCHMTYSKSGMKQVTTVGSEEKRAITVMASLSNNGILLPFQAIYQGNTARSQPSASARSYTEAINEGFLFESSNTATYWSTQETMRSFVANILAPYFERIKILLGLPTDQRCLWQIDCWSVHRSVEFMSWLSANYPGIIVNFVPARMTGLFQACDVGFQRLFKHSMKRTAHEDVVHEVLEKMDNGIAADQISVDSKISILRDRTVHWLWRAYSELNKAYIIKKAWEMCRVNEQEGSPCLSYESLTSASTRQMLRSLPSDDPVFFTELSRHLVAPPVLTEEEAKLEDVTAEDADVDFVGDDSVVPIEAVEDALMGHLPHNDGEQEFVVGAHGLVSNAEAEETFVESVNEIVIDTILAIDHGSLGRGQRKKFRNRNYDASMFEFTDDSRPDY